MSAGLSLALLVVGDIRGESALSAYAKVWAELPISNASAINLQGSRAEPGVATESVAVSLLRDEVSRDREGDTHDCQLTDHEVVIDGYGYPLTWACAADIIATLSTYDLGAPADRAAVAYLSCLPGNTWIVLEWR